MSLSFINSHIVSFLPLTWIICVILWKDSVFTRNIFLMSVLVIIPLVVSTFLAVINVSILLHPLSIFYHKYVFWLIYYQKLHPNLSFQPFFQHLFNYNLNRSLHNLHPLNWSSSLQYLSTIFIIPTFTFNFDHHSSHHHVTPLSPILFNVLPQFSSSHEELGYVLHRQKEPKRCFFSGYCEKFGSIWYNIYRKRAMDILEAKNMDLVQDIRKYHFLDWKKSNTYILYTWFCKLF